MQKAYLLIPVSSLVILFYLFTLLLSRLRIIKRSTHRKIWNVLLLITFLVTAVLGLFLAIQANYRFKVSFLSRLLILHVDFGIGMAVIAIIHFLWHWDYYTGLFTGKRKSVKGVESTEQPAFYASGLNTRRQILIPSFILGFTSLITQVIMLREFMLVFSGNELVIGIILAIWMILTGFGAYSGKFVQSGFRNLKTLTSGLVLQGALPIILVFLINFLRNIVFEPGTSIGILKMVFAVTILLMPFCMISGFLFTSLSSLYSQATGTIKIEPVYALESTGSIAGGVLFTYIFTGILSTFQILGILFSVNLLAVFIMLHRQKTTVYLIIPALVLLAAAPFAIHIDKFARQFLFRNQKLTFTKDTPFGNLSITDYGGQMNFFENNVLLFTTENAIANEEAVHYAMIQREHPGNVLLISGGISGITNEIEKYKPRRLDYVELNPWLFKIGAEFTTSLGNKNINIIKDDARIFVKKTGEKYDVILIHLPEPVTAQINRYYTLEFYRELKSVLNRNGIVSFDLPSTANYISREAMELNSSIYNTVKKVFGHVLIFPGENNYFVASDGPLTLKVVRLYSERNIDNTYVNQYYIDNESLIDRSEYILSTLEEHSRINRDYYPVSYFKQIRLWLSQFSHSKIPLMIGIPLVFLILLYFGYRSHPANLGMFTAGFAASSLEFVILIAFQVVYGYIYQVMGAFFAVFMAGLALGAIYRKKIFGRADFRGLVIIHSALVAMLFISLPCLALLKRLDIYPAAVYLISFILLFLTAGVVGAYFSHASSIQEGSPRSIAAKVYSTDLIGSAFGAFITAAVVLPSIGIYKTVLAMAVLSGLSLIVIIIKKTVH